MLKIGTGVGLARGAVKGLGGALKGLGRGDV